MRFIDLFAGLGGFHLALRDLGHECVFASEIDRQLQDLYEVNFGMRPAGDIRKIRVEDIPQHDILCAGFPCQPFSKAGVQEGLRDIERGSMFFEIMKIVKYHKPRFLILENVPNLRRHDHGATWKTLETALRDEGYTVDDQRLSPHHFGIPQNRDRVYIVGDLLGLDRFDWPTRSDDQTNIRTVLETQPADARAIPPQVESAINVWQEFLDYFPSDQNLPSFPIWAMEFGASYPYDSATPWIASTKELQEVCGSFGTSLAGMSRDEIFAILPSHARTPQERFPRWKQTFIRQNRELYREHKAWIDEWVPRLKGFPSSFQKFEWNAKGEVRELKQHVLQVRASGLRVKRDTTAPSLVAMTSTQVPIITWESRYMTPRECARLQSMDSLHLPKSPTRGYAALGNAVNVDVVKLIARALLLVDAPARQVDDVEGNARLLDQLATESYGKPIPL